MSDDNVTYLINDKTVGMDQLLSFDASGVPGPGVTADMAFYEVRRLAAALKELRAENAELRKQLTTHDNA